MKLSKGPKIGKVPKPAKIPKATNHFRLSKLGK